MRGIYIVEFDTYPGLYKIGKSKDIEERVKLFQNSTILLDNVRLLYCKEFEDYTKAEKDIHFLLKEYRCKENREFFKGNLQTFINIINSLDPNNYKSKKLKEKEKPIEVSIEAQIYLLQLQINELHNQIKELEEKENILYLCIKKLKELILDIGKKYLHIEL